MASPTATDVYGTSAWQVGNAGLTQKFSAILQKYGIVPDSGTLAKYGLSSLFDPNNAAGAATNPNSVYAQLGRVRDTNYEGNMHTANSHNALFSGAFQNSQDQTGRDYASGLGQAGQNELGDLMGVGGEQGNLYQTIYGQLLSQPVTPDPTVYPPSSGTPGGGPGPSPTTGIGQAVPQGPYQRTGPEAGFALTPGSKKVINSLKPKPIPKPNFSTTLGRY